MFRAGARLNCTVSAASALVPLLRPAPTTTELGMITCHACRAAYPPPLPRPTPLFNEPVPSCKRVIPSVTYTSPSACSRTASTLHILLCSRSPPPFPCSPHSAANKRPPLHSSYTPQCSQTFHYPFSYAPRSVAKKPPSPLSTCKVEGHITHMGLIQDPTCPTPSAAS